MIGTDRDVLMDQAIGVRRGARFGGPLTMLVFVLGVWVTGRAILWESPFTSPGLMAQAAQAFAEAPQKVNTPDPAKGEETRVADLGERNGVTAQRFASHGDQGPAPSFGGASPDIAVAHHSLWRAALTTDIRGTSWRSRRERFESPSQRQARTPVFPGRPPFVAKGSDQDTQAGSDRWSLGAWVFARDGSTTSSITPGPAPVYGASQMGANLRYRIAPNSGHDPNAYLRGVRSLIDQAETEVALGVSARPVDTVPVRVASEIRVTDNPFARDVRPAAFAITEIPPVPLPLRLAAEVYAAAGYVGGEADTGFVDGQATVTRGLTSFDLRRVDDVRVSVGAGAWGGAQRGVHRIDVGPTLRIDMALGSVPARVSVDYRERVGGDAAPASGVAATLSTQF